MNLTTGIRCVQRSPETIFRTVASARGAGLGDSPYLFVDGPFDRLGALAEWGTVVHRTRRSGAWPNFFLSLAELYLREPHADFYLLLEDDVVFCRDVAAYLKRAASNLEVASLFTSAKVEGRIASGGVGFHRQDPGWHIASGGQAWLFNNERLRQFLQSKFVVDYRRHPPQNLDPKHYRRNGLAHTDSVVGQFCRDAGCGIQYHYPSLAQHIGDESFMYPGFQGKRDVRYADHFPGEQSSALDFCESKKGEYDMAPANCVILVPVQGAIERECERGLQELERRGYPVRRVYGYAAIDQGRNQMATDALREGFAETLWIDADIEFHPDDVEKLRKYDGLINSAIYPKKGKRELASHVLPGTEKIVFGREGGLIEILYAATGFLHVRREAYETIREKLALPVCNESFGAPMIPFFQPLILDHPERGAWYLAEDFSFSERARQAGVKIYADTTIRLKHLGKYGFSWEDAGSDPQRFGTYSFHLK